jgi:hypothetical protein
MYFTAVAEYSTHALWSVRFCRYSAMLEHGVVGFFVKASGIAARPSVHVSVMD